MLVGQEPRMYTQTINYYGIGNTYSYICTLLHLRTLYTMQESGGGGEYFPRVYFWPHRYPHELNFATLKETFCPSNYTCPPSLPPSLSLPTSLPPSLPPSLSPFLPPSLSPSLPPSLPLSLPPSLPLSLPPSLPPSPSLTHYLPYIVGIMNTHQILAPLKVPDCPITIVSTIISTPHKYKFPF